MNGLVTKPVSYGELASAMRDILGGEWSGAAADIRATELRASESRAAAPPVLDLGLAAEALGVSRAEVRHLVPNAVAEIRLKLGLAERGVRAATLRETALQAHTLKSVAASIGAEATRRASLRLENAARREDQERSRERLAALRAEVVRLEAAAVALG
jgi:HPt (histidine-containing phosphotransfer) domain-containing protein